MGQLESYALELRNMPVGIQQFSYVVDDRFFKKMESADIRGGAVSATLTVKHDGDSFDLTLTVEGDIIIGCDRCLDDMAHHVEATYHTAVRYGDSYNDDSDELIVVPEGQRSLDLSGMIYDTIALTIPMKHVHPDGECNEEMTEKLREHTGGDPAETTETSDPRWEALRAIADNNNK